MDGLVDELRMHSVKHFFLRIIALTCMVTWIVITKKAYYLNFQIYNNKPLKNWQWQQQPAPQLYSHDGTTAPAQQQWQQQPAPQLYSHGTTGMPQQPMQWQPWQETESGPQSAKRKDNLRKRNCPSHQNRERRNWQDGIHAASVKLVNKGLFCQPARRCAWT